MYFFTLVVRYFADAQYDVRSPIVGFADTLPEGESEISFTVFASGAKQSPGRVNFRKVCTFSLKTWDISLTLNMTYFFIRHSVNVEQANLLARVCERRYS